MVNALLIAIVVVFTVAAQLVLKIGQYSLYYPKQFSVFEVVKMTALNLSNFYVVISILLTLVAGLAWVLVIQNIPLSRAYLFMSLNYVIVYIVSWWFFAEPLSVFSTIGMVLIVMGVSLLGFK